MKSDHNPVLEAALKIKLLLVDDEPEFLETLEKHLRRRKINTSVAEGCKVALDILEEQAIDVIVMDVSMPEIDGLQCLKKVKEKWPLIEVVILTGHASVKSGIEGMQGGAFDYCIKPIETQELVEKIELAGQKALINKQKADAES
ncbi:response regulator [Desulfogranum marinum]|uniref:response regulator n=1 Tax=Desulfogranum marinum TaxID=453220 RepID=UPI001965118E|nr:response regulator [Desulfogranum marinum]MBM9510955.1 response regulator [Desulfogranum marinum]